MNVGSYYANNMSTLNGEFFAKFIEKHFEELFKNSHKETRLWIQDSDPSQNSVISQKAMKRVNAQLLKIPPRSPDLNPIENVFTPISEILRRQAIERSISYETYEHFSDRVKSTILNFPKDKVNKLIESMQNRISQVIPRKGQRMKY